MNKPAKTLTGTVSDSMCAAHHMTQNMSAADGTRDWVKKGTKYALVVGKVTVVTFFTTILAAQMQMPGDGSAVSKSANSSAVTKTLTGDGGDALCGSSSHAKGKEPRLSVPETA